MDWRFGIATLVGIIVPFVIYDATPEWNKAKKLIEDYQASFSLQCNDDVV